jgi:hypothetical protein
MSDVSSTRPVIVKSDLVTENILLRATKREKLFVETQAKRELRAQANYLRALILQEMERVNG